MFQHGAGEVKDSEVIIEQRLKELRLKERRLVESIRYEIKKIVSDCEIVYLPNLMPRKKVKYIFIAMEPSFSRWSKDEENAKRRSLSPYKANFRVLI